MTVLQRVYTFNELQAKDWKCKKKPSVAIKDDAANTGKRNKKDILKIFVKIENPHFMSNEAPNVVLLVQLPPTTNHLATITVLVARS